MQETLEEETRLWFERVVTDVPVFEDLFREALGFLEEGERPYMWLRAHIDGLEGTRILVTDRRLAVFCSISGSFEAPQVVLEANYDLETLSAPPSIQQIDDRTVLATSFGTSEAQSIVTVVGISPAIAEEARRFLTLSANERTAVTALRGIEVRKTPGKKSSPLASVIKMIFWTFATYAYFTFVPDLLARLFLIGIMVWIVLVSWITSKERLFQGHATTSQGSTEGLHVLLWIILVYCAFIVSASVSPKVPAVPSPQKWTAEPIIEQRDKDLTILLEAVSPAERLVFAWLGGVRLPDVESRSESEVNRTAKLTGSLQRLRTRLWALSGVRLVLALLAASMVILLCFRLRQRTTTITDKCAPDSWTVQDGIFLWALAISSLLIIIFYIPLAIALVRSVRTGWVQPLSLPDIVYILGWLPTGLLVLAGRRNGKLFGARSNAGLWSGTLILLGVASLGYWFDRLGVLGLNAAMDWAGLRPGNEVLRQARPLITGSYFAVGFHVFFTVIVAPFFEEICYRGWLYGGLRKIVRPTWAIPISAAVFSFFHGFSLYGFVQIFWGGIIFAYLYEKTHRLWPGILVHATWNGLCALTILLLYR